MAPEKDKSLDNLHREGGEALRESERRYRLLADNITDIIWTTDLDLRFTYLSPSIKRVLGYEVEEALKLTLNQILTPDSYEQALNVVSEELAKERREGLPPGYYRSLELEHIRKNGSSMWLEVVASLLRDDAGRPSGLLGISRDITERRRIMEALRKSEAEARLLAEENSLIAEIGRLINSSLNIEDIYEQFAEKLKKLIPCDWVTINIVQSDDHKLLNVYASEPHPPGYRTGEVYPASGTIFAEIAQTRQLLHVPRKTPEIMSRFPNSKYLQAPEVAAFIATPIISKGEVVGSLHLQSRTPEIYGERDLRLTRLVADQIAGALANARLFAEQKKLEAELNRQKEIISQSSRRWRNTLDSLEDLVALLDRECRFLKVNRPLADFLGAHPRELIGRKCYELIHGTTSPPADCPHQKTLVTCAPGETEVFFPEVARYFLVKTTPLVSPEGDVGATVHVMRDITEQKKAQEVIRASEENYRRMYQQFYTLLNAIPDSITLCDPELKIVWANDTQAQELGLTPQELTGRHCYELAYQRSSPCPEELCPVIRSFRTGQADRQVKTNALGRVKDLRSFPIFDHNGAVVNVLEIERDITEHRALEEQLRQAQKMEAVGQLTGGIAHDFNNIMSVIMGYAQILQMKLGREGQTQKEVTEIIKAAERDTSLTKSLLAFSRRQKIHLAPVALNKIITDNKKLLDRILGEEMELLCRFAEDGPVIMADGTLLGQVLINLTVNARDAMSPGGKLLIETGRVKVDPDRFPELGHLTPGPYGLLIVSDNGVGMNEETRARIFEPFFTTKVVGKGTGLGLSIVFGIVAQHKGAITCESAVGHGATFKIYLPLAEADEQEQPAPDLEIKSVPGGSELILLAEDEEALRELSQSVLSQAGYRVIVAQNGREALEKFQEHQSKIDLLLLDVVMPEMNGREVYQAAQTIRPGVKAMFISGYTANILRDKGLPTDGVDLLMKPHSPSMLLTKVREILDRKA